MRPIMWIKHSPNLAIFGILLLLVLIVYWHHKLSILELQQKSIVERLGQTSILKGSNLGNFEYNHISEGYSGKDYLNNGQVVIYNRIPKTGSTTLMGISYQLCTKNGYNVIHLNTTKNSHTLTPADQMRFAQNISNWYERHPLIIHGHIGYIDFASLGVPLRPLYINLVRDPLERLVSYYYFLRFGDDFRPEVVRKKKGDKETFDECVSRDGPDCDPANLWMQVPFFCGHHSLCWEAGNAWALQNAKSNLAKYFLVGLTENMEEFVALLEVSLPKFFQGASALFNSDGKSHLRKTYGKTPPSKETLKKFRKSKIWQMEQDFYMFAKRNFMAIKKKSVSNNSRSPDIIIDPSPKFRFEKIRPKSKDIVKT